MVGDGGEGCGGVGGVAVRIGTCVLREVDTAGPMQDRSSAAEKIA